MNIQRTGLPKTELVENQWIQQGNPGGHAFQHRRQRDTGQRQTHRVEAAATQSADQRHQQCGEHRTGKGEPQILADVDGTKEGDPQHHGKACSGVNPENARIGQGVAGEGLHQHAGQAQRNTGQNTNQRTRQPGVGDDGAVRTAALAFQRLDHRVEGNRFSAE
ncbi:hypothetical protein D3C81_814200 [compost metagenome]